MCSGDCHRTFAKPRVVIPMCPARPLAFKYFSVTQKLLCALGSSMCVYKSYGIQEQLKLIVSYIPASPPIIAQVIHVEAILYLDRTVRKL